MNTKRIVIALAAVLALSPATVVTAQPPPQTKTWNAGTGNWSTAGNWTPAGVPVGGDDVRLTLTDGTNRTITYDYTGAAVTLNSLHVNLTNFGATNNTTTLSMPANNLTVRSEDIGVTGRGVFTQTGGTHTVGGIGIGDMFLGTSAGSNGKYNLGGTGTLNSNGHVYVGYNGTGTFNQSAGTIAINNRFLDVGRFNGSSGTYNLSDGSLTAAEEYVGDEGVGLFTQTGGTNTVTGAAGLTLGWAATGNGTYEISGGSLNVTHQIRVGNSGAGTLNIQSGGSVSTDALSINNQSTVNLSGGTLRFNTGTGLSRLNYTSGTIKLAGNRTFDVDPAVGFIFGVIPTIPSGKALVVEGTASFLSFSSSNPKTVSIDGGRLTSSALYVAHSALSITNGGTMITTNSASLGGEFAGPHAEVTVSGLGSSWTSSTISIGDQARSTLTIQDQALVSVGSSIAINGVSTVNLDGGTLRFNTISGLDRLNYSSGTIQLAGARNVGTDTTIQTLFGALPVIATGKGLTVEGTATLSKPLTINGGKFTANSLEIDAGGALQFDRGVLEITGGTISGLPNLIVPANGELRANGVQALRITGTAGSTITATGNLTLGNAAAVNGFATQGMLQVGANTVTLLDANDVVFDSLALAALGSGGNPGTLAAANGLTLNFGGNITGFGTISTPNSIAKPLINNGHITGNSAAQRITLPGHVKGVGTFDNVNFTGTFSPGLSPAILTVGNVALSPTSTLVMELGGTSAGSGYDQIQSSGALAFDGTLQVSLINGFTPAAGQSFNLFDWASTSGTFDTVQLPTLAGLTWNTSQLYTTGVLSLVASGIPGDYNQNGTVDAADYTVWRDRLGSGTSLPNDDTAGVGPDDYDRWKTNFGHVASGASAAVPEPTSYVAALLLAMALAARGHLARRRSIGDHFPA